MHDEPYILHKAQGDPLPILISVPHCGIEFPVGEAGLYHEAVVQRVEDTDWCVHDLYDFAPRLGITVIQARFSRYVVDLNRNPAGEMLYSDGRTETPVVPLHTFSGLPIYRSFVSNPEFIAARVKNFHEPYYERIGALLSDLRNCYKEVLFFDAHSIRRQVPQIPGSPFPDLMLGDRDGSAAGADVSEIAFRELRRGAVYEVVKNFPFKGGNLTRHWGKPKYGIHALQLEMCQDLYLDAERHVLDQAKCIKLRPILQRMLEALAERLKVTV